MKQKLLLLLCALCVSVTQMVAQVTVVRGTVTAEEDGEPVIGASVVVKGTSVGAVTDVNGKFVLRDVPASARKLVVSYVGMITSEVGIAPEVNVKLVASSELLDEVVISVPYGTAKKSTFTGSAGYIDGKAIEKSQVSNVSKALQGTVPGLQSFSSSGQPGSEATILIRGVGSVNASSDPLYVVDGVPYDGTLSSIASSDIASITVLKDAASAALYGSRAANGVIMITTKQGQKESRPTIELNAKYGFSSRARSDYKQLNTDQYFQLYWEALRNYRLDSGDSAADAAQYASNNLVARLGINPYGTAYPNPVDTDGKLVQGAQALWNDSWDDALTQDAHYTDINVRVSGGSKTSSYYVSGGVLDDQGAYIESGFKRYTLRTNIVSDLRPWLQVGLNVSGTHSIQDYPKQDDSTISNVVLFARNVPSFYPIYERDLTTGEYLLDESGNRIFDYGTYRASSYAKYNLLASMPHDLSRIKRDAATLRGYVLLTPLKGLSYKLSLNVDYDSSTEHYYTNPTYGTGSITGGSVSKENTRTTGMTFNQVINYDAEIKQKHYVKVMAGQEYYEFNTSNFGGARSGVIADGYYEPDAASTLSDFYGNSDQYKLLSFFGSAEYNYDHKYYVSASVRTDGSSRFHPDNRWGTFYSVGASWKIMEEAFMAKAKNNWLSNLSLRISYGAQGNDNVGYYYAYQALYSILNNLGESGLRASRLATPDLSWETNLNFNVGVDFGLWNNRLSGTVEYFVRRSKDLLFSTDLVPSSGFSSMTENIGALKNYGWEFQITGIPVLTKDWKWRLSLNATTYKNKITSLPSEEMWSGNKKWVEGGSLYDWYLYEWAGVNPDNGHSQWYRYVNGEKVVTEDYSTLVTDDKVKVGNSLPDVTGGLSSELSYKNWSLSFLLSYSLGGKLYNGDKVSLLSQASTGSGWSIDMLNRWTEDNRYTDVPRLTTNAGTNSWTGVASTRFLVDRSYARMKNITLSYTLPKTLLNKLTLDDASIYLQAENLFTICGQQGLDPEQTVGGTTYYRYPAMKTISFGINIKL